MSDFITATHEAAHAVVIAGLTYGRSKYYRGVHRLEYVTIQRGYKSEMHRIMDDRIRPTRPDLVTKWEAEAQNTLGHVKLTDREMPLMMTLAYSLSGGIAQFRVAGNCLGIGSDVEHMTEDLGYAFEHVYKVDVLHAAQALMENETTAAAVVKLISNGKIIKPWFATLAEAAGIARQVLNRHWGAVLNLGNLLLDQGTIYEVTIARFMHSHRVHRNPVPIFDEEFDKFAYRELKAHEAITACKGNKSAAARMLGISRNTLRNWL